MGDGPRDEELAVKTWVWIPSTKVKSWAWQWTPTAPALRMQRREDLGSHWPASLANQWAPGWMIMLSLLWTQVSISTFEDKRLFPYTYLISSSCELAKWPFLTRVCTSVCVYVCAPLVMEMESSASHTSGKCATTEPHLQPPCSLPFYVHEVISKSLFFSRKIKHF